MSNFSGLDQRERDIQKYTKKEDQFKSEIEFVCNIKLQKDYRHATITHNYSEIDYMIVDPKNLVVKGYMELKTSNNTHDQWDQYVIDHSKLAYIRAKAQQTTLPIYIAVRWQDVDMVYEFNPRHSFTIQWKGRTINKRGDFDQKEIEYIPIKKHFRKLRGDLI